MQKFEGDLQKVKALGFEFSRDEYVYAWLVGMRHHSWYITRPI